MKKLLKILVNRYYSVINQVISMIHNFDILLKYFLDGRLDEFKKKKNFEPKMHQ